MEDGSKGTQWVDSEMLDLISIWVDSSMQAKPWESNRNWPVFEDITKQMAERGHRRTWLQYQLKLKTLKVKFNEAKDSTISPHRCMRRQFSGLHVYFSSLCFRKQRVAVTS